MEKATISQLKNGLSAYLKKVLAGQTIVVFDRKRPVARIERMGAEEDPDDRVSRLESTGLLRRARNPLSIESLRNGAPRASRSVVQALLEERRESR